MSLVIKTVKTSSLKPYGKNPRKNDAAVGRMVAAINEFGFRIPIVAKSDGTVVDGHLRLKAAIEIGLETVPVAIADELSDEQVRAFRLLANKSANWAEWDDMLLADELRALGSEGFDLSLTGFDDVEIVSFLTTGEGLTDPDEVPEAPAIPVSRLGDIWLCGNHRVMCGNSLSLDDVGLLLDGCVPDLANCDPPYGISVVKGSSVGGAKPFGKVGGGKPHPFAGKKEGRGHGHARNAIIQPGVYAPIIGDDSTDTAHAAYALLKEIGVRAIVLWGGNYYADRLPASRCWLVWDKENTGTFADAELAWTNQDAVVRLFRHQWSGLIKASERGERRVHPTQKPVALSEWVFDAVAPKAKTMIDLFLGSGSSLIAGEGKGVICYGMEMSEPYVDVIVTRWQAFTGHSATLEGDGRTFDEIQAERMKEAA